MDENYFTGTVKVDGKDHIWTSAFPKGTSFECRRCSLCCHGKIDLDVKDVTRLERYGPRDLFVQKESDSDQNPDPHSNPDLKCAMSTNEDNSCIHLHPDSSCKIYDIRPSRCKLYPFKLSPDLDNHLVLDVEYHCPFVDQSTSEEMTEEHVGDIVKQHISLQEKNLKNLISAKAAFVDYLHHLHTNGATNPTSHATKLKTHTTNPSANVENKPLRRQTRLTIMDHLIDILCQSPLSINHAKAWSKSIAHTLDVSVISHILDKQKVSKISRTRVRRVMKHNFNSLLYLNKGLDVVKITLSNRSHRLKIGDKYVSIKKLEQMPYSVEALKKVSRYLKTNVRRSSFQRCYAQLMEHATSNKMSITDPAAESAILANALFPLLDTFCRIAAAHNSNDNITGPDVSLAISNIDKNFSAALSDNSLFHEIVKSIN